MLSSEDLFKQFSTSFIGKTIIYYDSLPSTMDAAREAGQQGALEGTVVIVEKQTGGRGRRQRSWVSSKGSVTLSVILRPSFEYLHQMIMLASLAVCAAIEKATNLKTGIKWPNDVLIKGKKVCGILIENQICGNKPEFTIIGIGINVNIDPADYPEIADTATSLSAELGYEVSRSELVQELMIELERLYLDMKAGKHLHQKWRNRMVILGQRVHIIEEGKLEQGIAEDVDIDGSLLLRSSVGELKRIIAGDVTLRPVP